MTIALAQAAVQNKGTGVTNITVTLGAGTTAGNTLIVAFCSTVAVAGSNPVTLGGSATNATQRVAEENSSGPAWAYIYEIYNIAGGQTAVKLTMGSSASILGTVFEVSGLVATGAFDKSNKGTSTSAATFSSGSSGTLSQANEFVVGIVADNSQASNTFTGPSSPWTNEAQQQETAVNELCGYQIVSATTALTYSGTSTGNEFSASAIATFEGSSVVTVTLTTPNLALAAPLVSVDADATVSLTAPNLALAAPLVSVDADATVSLTTPNLALAAPLVTPGAGASVSLTTPNLALAAPLVTPETSGAVTVNLTAPNLALAAPLVTPAAKSAGVAGLLLAWPP